MNDDDLKQLLKAWEAPSPAPNLLARTELRLQQDRVPWWKRGAAIRFAAPVPAAAAGILALAITALLLVSTSAVRRREIPPSSDSTAAIFSVNGFQPVQFLRPEVIRRSHAQ